MHTAALKKLTLIIVIMLTAVFTVPERVEADAVTDHLSVAIGYPGMQLSEYVVVGDYHWSELMDNLPLYEQAYSYYQGSSTGDLKFTEIVDAARGFPLRELLEYAHIYYDDILNLQFYVIDHSGIQAAFDRDVLFQDRYYFEDYIGHLHWIRDDDFKVTGYDSKGCWDYCEKVEPMLALEDNWMSYSIDPKLNDKNPEHSLPDWDHANPSTRFRLLFGQTNPEETLTSQSAKYVRTIYVTLRGKPEYDGGESLPELDGSYGSHTMETTVSVNSGVRDALDGLLNMASSNEEVLVIKGVRMEQDDFYTDLMHVYVDYEIIGEGEAYISARIGTGEISEEQAVARSSVVSGSADPNSVPEKEESTQPEKQETSGTKPEDKNNSSETGNRQSENDGEKGSSNKSGISSGRGNSNNGTSGKSGSSAKSKSKADASQQAKRADSKTKPASVSAVGVGNTSAFILSKDIQNKLNKDKNKTAVSSNDSVNEDVTEFQPNDNLAGKKEIDKRILLCTGVGSALIVILGGLWEMLSFSMRMKKGKCR